MLSTENGEKIQNVTDKIQHGKLKIEQREPHGKPWVNSSVPEG
jgi:hypothetical protein